MRSCSCRYMVSSTKISRLISPLCISTNDRAGCFIIAVSGWHRGNQILNPIAQPVVGPLGTWFAFSRTIGESLTPSRLQFERKEESCKCDLGNTPKPAGLGSNAVLLSGAKTILVEVTAHTALEHRDW